MSEKRTETTEIVKDEKGNIIKETKTIIIEKETIVKEKEYITVPVTRPIDDYQCPWWYQPLRVTGVTWCSASSNDNNDYRMII